MADRERRSQLYFFSTKDERANPTMETELRGTAHTVYIGSDHPTVLIGERINPTSRKVLAEKLRQGDLLMVEREAIAQVQAGADIIDVNVGTQGVDQSALLPRAVECVQQAVDVPISIDTDDPKALEESLKVYQGKPLVNSVNGEERALEAVLPLVAEYEAAVIGLCMDDRGVPGDAEVRIAIAHKIFERAQEMGIRAENILMDPLCLSIGTDSNAGCVTLNTIRGIKDQLGVNMTIGASNVSFGMPDRGVINSVFLAMALQGGINAPIVRVDHVREFILAADLLLGKDPFAKRFIKDYRARQKAET
jgi:5-methyltetrahydrofolate--homocysteine methyltransferase